MVSYRAELHNNVIGGRGGHRGGGYGGGGGGGFDYGRGRGGYGRGRGGYDRGHFMSVFREPCAHYQEADTTGDGAVVAAEVVVTVTTGLIDGLVETPAVLGRNSGKLHPV